MTAPAPPHGPRSPSAGTVAPKAGQMRPVEALGAPLAPSSPCPVPPVPLARLLAGLQRSRAALVTRQAQLAACRTCGAEAEAYRQAAADVDLLALWLLSLPGYG